MFVLYQCEGALQKQITAKTEKPRWRRNVYVYVLTCVLKCVLTSDRTIKGLSRLDNHEKDLKS